MSPLCALKIGPLVCYCQETPVRDPHEQVVQQDTWPHTETNVRSSRLTSARTGPPRTEQVTSPTGSETQGSSQPRLTRAESTRSLLSIQGIHLPTENDEVPATLARQHSFCRSISGSGQRDKLRSAQDRPLLKGSWKCVETNGFSEFLDDMGVPWLHKAVATSAPWPRWQIDQNGDYFKLVSHTALGRITEEFCADGGEYTMHDGRNQLVICSATWKGDALCIERSNPQGRFLETRVLNDSRQLLFDVQAQGSEKNATYDRKFERVRS